MRSLLYCDRYCKSSVGLQTGHKRITIVTYHAATILGDQAIWPGVVPSDVRRSDLVNKHIKRSIAIFVQFFRLKLKFLIHWLQFNSIRLNSNQDSCIQRRVVIKHFRSWSQTCCGNSIPTILVTSTNLSSTDGSVAIAVS